ncbi:MAG: serpin family protein [Planctomycetes bacterium]|nr:serpin family protein [Planctomycetota bacterium]
MPKQWILIGLLLTVAAVAVAVQVLRTRGSSGEGPYFTNVTITPDTRAAAKSSNGFAFDLYRHMRTEPGNLFFSPASISTALAMTYAGAAGETRQQMARTLHFQSPDEQLHSGFGTMVKLLNSRGEGYRLRMANRLWGQQTSFRPEFLRTTREEYGAELAQVDFGQSERARQLINDWVQDQTAGKIANLIPPGALKPATRLVLTNAIYFKGTWDQEFLEEATQDSPFQISPGQQVSVPMMNQTEIFHYAETDQLQVLELPYKGHEVVMLILLPKQVDGLADVEQQLTADNVRRWTLGLRDHDVRVFLPRFALTAAVQLTDLLISMGMPLAFSDQADFSGMSTSHELMITDVVHQALVDVNEEGTEAAAATWAAAAETSAAVSEPTIFRADHPFVFLIRDQRTGAILFLGRLIDPRG